MVQNINEEDKQKQANIWNNVSGIMAFLISVINIVITAFGFDNSAYINTTAGFDKKTTAPEN